MDVSRSISSKEEVRLTISKKKIIRRIWRVYENGSWTSKANKEIEDLVEKENIVRFAKWKGWVMAVCQESSCKELGKENDQGRGGSKIWRRA